MGASIKSCKVIYANQELKNAGMPVALLCINGAKAPDEFAPLTLG